MRSLGTVTHFILHLFLILAYQIHLFLTISVAYVSPYPPKSIDRGINEEYIEIFKNKSTLQWLLFDSDPNFALPNHLQSFPSVAVELEVRCTNNTDAANRDCRLKTSTSCAHSTRPHCRVCKNNSE